MKIITTVAVLFTLSASLPAIAASQCELLHEDYGTKISVCRKQQAKDQRVEARDKIAMSVFQGPNPTCKTMVQAGAYKTLSACEKSQTTQKARSTLNKQLETSIF
ncbi:hypothetical protein [Acidithiobacillus thiooxidans]|uniref:hypothetical protein n=1 Tax=Acidithiobacillus thiooxidans TaxID=930 RepID=UPI0009DA3C72|nr:hypothetical protein [Acidithiobacillus thiooxidans]